MTTTLRAAGPEERPSPGAAAGARSRTYDILDSGRRSGGVRLWAEGRGDCREGGITDLEVDATDRRRGRATVAVLVAEEVLRDWGCRRVGIRVPDRAAPALRLARTLGYVEHAREVRKPLTAHGPGLPADCRLVPQDGGAPEEPVPYVLHHRGTAVGTLLLSLEAPPRVADAGAWIHSVRVGEQYRRRGHGRALLLAAEEVCRKAGRLGLGAAVPCPAAEGGADDTQDDETPWNALGYRTVARHLDKSLV
ncbi:GNAT family N-acetyltransferase [Streptomyces sp. TR02-1]|uniref:GNAT family N-acetyltransferase n=1 Tax=Streptomyces sp. TR02-1 TaxID=3385977 RepID=UPI0039A01CCB